MCKMINYFQATQILESHGPCRLLQCSINEIDAFRYTSTLATRVAVTHLTPLYKTRRLIPVLLTPGKRPSTAGMTSFWTACASDQPISPISLRGTGIWTPFIDQLVLAQRPAWKVAATATAAAPAAANDGTMKRVGSVERLIAMYGTVARRMLRNCSGKSSTPDHKPDTCNRFENQKSYQRRHRMSIKR